MAGTEFEFYLSGGAANTDPNLSLGGAISTTQIATEIAAYNGSGISGITITGSSNSGENGGVLYFNVASSSLVWIQDGEDGVADNVLILTGSGDFVLPSITGLGCLFLTVVFGSLPVSDQSANVVITRPLNALFRDILESEAINGIDHLYRAFYIKNVSGAEISCSLGRPKSTGGIELYLGFPVLESSVLLANETDDFPLASFEPSFDVDGETSKIDFGIDQAILLWLKLTIPANSIKGYKASYDVLSYKTDASSVLRGGISIDFNVLGENATEIQTIILKGGLNVGVITECTLTGLNDNESDIKLKISSFQATLYRDKPSFISVSIPNKVNVISDIEARPNGDLQIDRTIVYQADSATLNQITLPRSGFRFDQGASRSTSTLEGRGVLTLPAADLVTVQNITGRRSVVENGVSMIAFSLPYASLANINPGDTFVDGGDTYLINRIQVTVTVRSSRVFLYGIKQ